MAHSIDRRRLLQGAAGLAAAGTLGGCAMGGDDGKDAGAKGETRANNPLGVKEDAPLEIVIFNGGSVVVLLFYKLDRTTHEHNLERLAEAAALAEQAHVTVGTTPVAETVG